jgi:GNAT superfamily N-acetyltransferase
MAGSGGITVTRAQPIDAGAVGKLFAMYRVFYGQDADERACVVFVGERLRLMDSVILVAKRPRTPSTRPDGFVQLLPKLSSTQMRRDWILNDLFVVPEARRQGVAKALMAEAETFARRTGAGKLSLKTQRTNDAARRLYEAQGWSLDDEFLTYAKRV